MTPPSESAAAYLRKKWVVAADGDYTAARICEGAFLGRQFVWHAAQAIEKYSKCILILNGKSIKKISHETYSDLVKIDAPVRDLLPEVIDLTKHYKTKVSLKEFTFEEFNKTLERFEQQGHPSSRYRETNLRVQPYDLQKLDFIELPPSTDLLSV